MNKFSFPTASALGDQFFFTVPFVTGEFFHYLYDEHLKVAEKIENIIKSI